MTPTMTIKQQIQQRQQQKQPVMQVQPSNKIIRTASSTNVGPALPH